MLDDAQEAIAGLEALGVLVADVAALPQPCQGQQRLGRPDRLVRAPVDQLQELRGELDVPQAAGAQLDLRIRVLRGQQSDDPAAHGPDAFDEPLALARGPHVVAERVGEVAAQHHVPGDGTRLQQGLELPRLRDVLVVRVELLDGAQEATRLSLGPQSGVQLPQRGLAPRCAHDLGDPGDHRLRDAHGVLIRRLSVRGCVRRGRVGVDDVDIGHVVELPRAALAHRDDGHADASRRIQLGARDRERGLDGGPGQIGQDPAHLVDHGLGRGDLEVIGSESQHDVPVGAPQRVGALLPRDRGDRGGHLPVRIRAHCLEERIAQRFRGRVRHVECEEALLPQRECGVRVTDHVVRERLGGPGDGQQALQEDVAALRVAQDVEELLGLCGDGGLDDPQQPQRRGVRVDCRVHPVRDRGLLGEVRAQQGVDLAQEPRDAADPLARAPARGITAAPAPRRDHREPKSRSSSNGVTWSR